MQKIFSLSIAGYPFKLVRHNYWSKERKEMRVIGRALHFPRPLVLAPLEQTPVPPLPFQHESILSTSVVEDGNIAEDLYLVSANKLKQELMM